ncbi:MAG: ABC transporter ATP-binding protein [Deltaproteobacteria bacterium]|nr:ABC transporter ATP-binding protein [Deltaproteobacteria bacterium]
MTAAIEAIHLHYAYGEYPVLKDISFLVDREDFFIVIGPNGSGKTTLLKLIAAILTGQQGTLRLLGKPVQRYSRSEMAKTIALVPQVTTVDFPFSVTEMVLMGRSPHLGILGMERRADLEIAREAMAFTDVLYLADRKVGSLSGGELQRVSIARAICQQPRILLLDEPTAALDLGHQIKVMDLMEKLGEETRLTIVMVSHDVNLAAMYANRLLLLKKGEIVSQGSPDEVLTYPNLEAAYDCPLLVDQSPLGGFQRVTQVPRKLITECQAHHSKAQGS